MAYSAVIQKCPIKYKINECKFDNPTSIKFWMIKILKYM